MTTKAAILSFALAMIFSGAAQAQDQPIKVKGGHELNETAQQFFSEGREKEVLAACAAGNYKGVDKGTKREAKSYCAMLTDTRRRAVSGERSDYESGGDPSEERTDKFTFDGGRLVKVQLRYAVPGPESNYQGLTFDQILAGMRQTYGPPARETVSSGQTAYGVAYQAHTELWLLPQGAISITQDFAAAASTTLTAFTRAEYDRSMAAGAQQPNPLK